MRLRKYTGEGPETIDPHWDFERDVGEGYDSEALRPWRARLFVPGTRPVVARLRLWRAPDADLPAHAHVRRFTGGDARSPASYAPIEADAIEVAPPLAVLAIDVTALDPGDYTLSMNVEGDVEGGAPDETDVYFCVRRRPLFTFHHPVEGRALRGRPSVRSCTGLREVGEGPASQLLAAHRCTVYRSDWAPDPKGSAYARVERLDVVAVTLLRPDCTPERTRWRVATRAEAAADPVAWWSGQDFDHWLAPGDHAAPPDGAWLASRFGLPFPVLVGLPRQPDDEGGYSARSRGAGA
jgi:hypothetical protein